MSLPQTVPAITAQSKSVPQEIKMSQSTVAVAEKRSDLRWKHYIQTYLSPSLGQKPELRVWIAHDGFLKAICELEFGWFFAGNCYLILNTRSRGKSVYSDVYAWIGSNAMDPDIGLVLCKAREIREFIGLQNCAIHRESQHSESPALLQNFHYLRYTFADRFHFSGQESRKKQSDRAFGKLVQHIVRKESVPGTVHASSPRGDKKVGIDGGIKIQPAPPMDTSNSPGKTIPLPFAQEHSRYSDPIYAPEWTGSKPALFQLHSASKIRNEAGSGSIVIEQIPLFRSLSRDRELEEELKCEGDNISDEEEEDALASAPVATVLPSDSPFQLPTGWKIWNHHQDFMPTKGAIYVFESSNCVWLLSATTSEKDIDKKIEGAIPVAVPGNESSQDEMSAALAWAKGLANTRGHGKLACIDSDELVVNKLWISLGVSAKKLPNALTVSESKLAAWEANIEQDRLENLEDESATDGDDEKQVPLETTGDSHRDPTPFFPSANLYLQAHSPILYHVTRISEVNRLEFDVVEEGKLLKRSKLFSDSVFVIDKGNHVYVWVGRHNQSWFHSNTLFIGQEFVFLRNLVDTVPVTGLCQKGEDEGFMECFMEGDTDDAGK